MQILPLTLALVVALVAAVIDLRSRRIPNLLTLGALATGLVLQLVLGGVSGGVLALLGAVACGVPATGLFLLRGLGGGDVKLLAACGAMLGPAAGFQLLLATAIAGGALAAVMVLGTRASAVTGSNVLRLLGHWRARGLTPCPAVSLGRSRGVVVPYGVAIACGMAFTFASRVGLT